MHKCMYLSKKILVLLATAVKIVKRCHRQHSKFAEEEAFSPTALTIFKSCRRQRKIFFSDVDESLKVQNVDFQAKAINFLNFLALFLSHLSILAEFM
jgi:hypothetical protein